MKRVVLAAAACACALLAAGACNDATRDLLSRPYDAGFDGPIDAPLDVPPPPVDATFLGGPCSDDAQCDDHIPCTFDACDATLHRCRNVPDDTRCDDGVYCDGHEACDTLHGCIPGPPVTCDDNDECTIDRCVETAKGCEHDQRDLDLDGDPDDHCVPHHDCNDLDPTVASTHAEVCANMKDDNCNGQVDETPCVLAAGDVCATAVAVPANATTPLSTAGDNKDYSYTCDFSSSVAGARDFVAAVTVPPGPNKDLDVWVTTPNAGATVAIESTCGDPSTELACGSGGSTPASAVRARARNVGPGTYDVIATTIGESTFELEATLLVPTPKPTDEDCASPTPVATDTPFAVSIIDPTKDLVSACAAATGELTYSFTLAQPADVSIYATTTQGSGSPVIGLRDAHCSDPQDELFCNTSTAIPLLARALAAGTYVVTVAATSPIDASVIVRTAPPTPAPPNETCAAPPTPAINATTPVDLSNHESAIADGCDPGGPTAAYDLSLAFLSDVLLVARYPETEQGGLSFDGPSCDAASRLACASGFTPVRIDKQSVAAGDYRIVLTDQVGALASLTTLVRIAVPPTIVSGADTCATAATIPAAGGFFTGDTTNAPATYPSSCDAAGQGNGAPDQVFSLTLAQAQRVVFDMEGSTYTTLLDVRQGATCPGTEVTSACYVGFGAARSFLDLELAAGQYWVVVSGYAGGKGPFDLDVRVVPP